MRFINRNTLVPIALAVAFLSWNPALAQKTLEPSVTFNVGGRLMFDAQVSDGDDELEAEVGEFKNGTEVRRARLFARGTLNEVIDYKLQFDFAGDEVTLKDAWLAFLNQRVIVGRATQNVMLEDITSSKYNTFIERANVANTFSTGRITGLHLLQPFANDRVFAFIDAGVADEGGDSDFDTSAATVSGRLVATPLLEEGKVVHVAGWVKHVEHEEVTDDDEVASHVARFRSRPSVHLGPRFVDTGDIVSDGSNLVGVEAATVMGPWSFQGEYVFADVDSPDAGDPTFQGFYAQASFFLTGESRAYQDGGYFGRVKINQEYGAGGTGAWELAARYSFLDLNDAEVPGGELQDVTVGLNWYATKHARLMVNYVFADVDGLGDANLVTTRMQVDF